jgi:hypothetical protein
LPTHNQNAVFVKKALDCPSIYSWGYRSRMRAETN